MYRVRRTPAYQRAKKRGTGTTTRAASVKALAAPGRHGSTRRPSTVSASLGTRLDEVGAEIQRVVGLDRTQFVQTIVLPQGEFANFLRANPEDRRGLLQKIFGTEVYERRAAAARGAAPRGDRASRGGASGSVVGVAAARRSGAADRLTPGHGAPGGPRLRWRTARAGAAVRSAVATRTGALEEWADRCARDGGRG